MIYCLEPLNEDTSFTSQVGNSRFQSALVINLRGKCFLPKN